MDLSMGHDMDPNVVMPGAAMILDARTGATRASTLLDAMNHNVVFAPNQREVWTSQMMMPGMILVLDAGNLAMLQQIEVGDMPSEITFSPDGRQGWVAETMSNTVSAINPTTKAVFATIPVGELPIVPSQGNDGHVYVDNEHGMSVSVVDRSHLHVDFTINLGFTPGMAKLGPDGRVWVTDADNGRVVLFSASGGQKVAAITTQAGAHAIDFSSSGRKAYVSNQMANSVSVIDVSDRRVIRTICVGNKPNGVLFRRKTF